VISQHHALHQPTLRQWHFKRVSLDSAGDRTHQRQAHLAVVARWLNHQCWAASSLFAATLGSEVKPDQIASLRCSHHTSAPMAPPHSVSLCWLSAVISARSALKWMASAGLASKAPASTFTSISLPEPTPSSAA